MDDKPAVSQEAKKWSELGAAKGGKARANVLTPQERSDIARQAVRARWAKAGKLKDRDETSDGPHESQDIDTSEDTEPEIPYSMFRGTLNMAR